MPVKDPFEPVPPVVAKVRETISGIASSDPVTRYAAGFLAVAAALIFVTTVREVSATAVFRTGVNCAQGALLLYSVNKILRVLRVGLEMLVYNHEHFEDRVRELFSTEHRTLLGVDGLLGIAEEGLASRHNGQGPTGEHPITRLRR